MRTGGRASARPPCVVTLVSDPYNWALFQTTYGRLPFGGSTVAEAAASILKESTQPLPPHVLRGLRAVTQRSLSKDSSQRYATTGELRAVLEAIASSGQNEVPSDARPAAPASIAVLPFADMSPQKDQDYFCEGVVEEIINALSGIDGLRVAARTSSFKFKGQAVDATDGQHGRLQRPAAYLAWIPARFDQAVTEARRGAALDPLNASSHIWLGLAL